MKRRMGLILLVLVGAACLAVAALAAWYQLFMRLPDPNTANRAGLVQWLVLRDLSTEPQEVQLALVDRLQAELKAGWQATSGEKSLGPAFRARLHKNAAHLQELWFKSRAAKYAGLAADEQMCFLSEQIETVARWSAVELPLDDPGSRPAEPGDSATRFFVQIEDWIETAKGDEREQMIRAVQDGVVCWLAMRDLAEQPRVVRRELAKRIVRELNAGLKLDEILLDLSAAQRKRLLANGELLLEAWLCDEARAFAALPEAERPAYIDRQIDDVMRWGVLEALGAPEGQPDESTSQPEAGSAHRAARLAGLARLSELVPNWLERAEPAERGDLAQLVSHVQARLLQRQLLRK
jgi:hypothetical protein